MVVDTGVDGEQIHLCAADGRLRGATVDMAGEGSVDGGDGGP